MRALICTQFGTPEDLSVDILDDPVPGNGEIVIDVAAAGITYVDTLTIQDKHQNKHALPFAPGMEVSGTVTSVGPGVEDFRVDEQVAALVYDGGHAERVIAKAYETFHVPHGCDMTIAGGLLSVALTSELALTTRARLQAGESVLVGGAAGGVGITTIQLAKRKGAFVIAAASSDARLNDAAAAGADATLTYGEAFRDRLHDINKGRDVDVIVDPVGGDFAEMAANTLDWNGRYVIVGFAGGGVPQFAANRLLVKNRSVHGLALAHYRRHDTAELKRAAGEVFQAIINGSLNAALTEVNELENVPHILRGIMNRQFTGKAVLVMK